MDYLHRRKLVERVLKIVLRDRSYHWLRIILLKRYTRGSHHGRHSLRERHKHAGRHHARRHHSRWHHARGHHLHLITRKRSSCLVELLEDILTKLSSLLLLFHNFNDVLRVLEQRFFSRNIRIKNL